ncbi:acetylxylan esterase [Rubritalea sp.]|uniref:acetylxylan esterase n=1 Tax=Rubritalea sp. TaxID=2109375 RepID=UPI003EF4EBE3
MNLKIAYSICIAFCLSLTANADHASDRAAIEGLANLTTAPTLYEVDESNAAFQSSETVTDLVPSETEQTLKNIFFDSIDYNGNPTRVYAWVGMPKWQAGDAPLPAVVLVHGGSGMAYSTWVDLWAERGYVAIAIDTEGAANTTSRHNKGGPRRSGVFNEANVDIGNQFMYHATAGSILANSLMRSLTFVDETKVGIHGVSWGGVITSTVIGVDTRFAFAIPTYGCGHMWDGIGKWQEAINNAGGTDYYKNVWDPMLYLENATMPIMWLTWLNDSTFNLDCQANSYNQAPGTRMVSMIQGMKHSHAFTWRRADSYDFADSIVGNNAGSVGVSANNPWCVQKSLSLVGDQVTVSFESTRPLTSATLYHSNEMGDSKAFSWTTVTLTDFAETSTGSGIWQGTATLPSDVTAWFVNVTADTSIFETNYLPGETNYVTETVFVSSRLEERVIIQQPSLVAMELASADTSATASVSVDFTAIHNLEITSVEFINPSHPGAFSTTEEFTFGLVTGAAFDVTFNNSIAGLTSGESASTTLRLTWVALDNVTTDTIDIPLSATVSSDQSSAFTWDGGGSKSRWSTAGNWLGDSAPPTDSTIEVVLADAGSRTSSNTYNDYELSSLSFDESIDEAFTINVFRSSAYVRTLTMDNNGSSASITVEAGAEGDCLIDDYDTAGSLILNDHLNIVHHGSGSLVFDLTISQEDGESNGITKSGTGAVIFSGLNTYTGDTIVEAGSLTLEPDASLSFIPTTNGICNQIAGVTAGSGIVNLNGHIHLNLENANSSPGNSWLLVGETDLTANYSESTFSVNSSLGAFSNNEGIWTLESGVSLWTFSESTGSLEVTTIAAAAYNDWATSSFTHLFTDTDSSVDFDNDGLSNFLEFVFGGDPTISEEGIAPVVSESNTGFQVSFRRSDIFKQSPTASIAVEVSGDLSFSSPEYNIVIGNSTESGPIEPLGASYTVENSDGLDSITATIPMASTLKNFVRLSITQ